MRQHCFIRGKWASVVIVLVLVLSCCQNTKGDLDTPSDGVLVGNINVSNISVGENNATVHEKHETSSLKEEEHRNDSSSSRAEELFKKAIATRLKDHASKEELRLSVHQLYAAAGIVHLSMNHSSASGYEMNGSLYYTADDVQVEWRNGTIQHIDAVRELIFAFRDGTTCLVLVWYHRDGFKTRCDCVGSGVPLNPAIAHRLVKELAAVGIAEFQADLGVLYSVGVEPVAPNDDDWLFVLKEPDLDLAMLHFSFAAKGDDPLAKMALGFRYYHVCVLYMRCWLRVSFVWNDSHRNLAWVVQGLGVEKSCPAALLYYEPVASSVVSAATVNGGLPTINDMRLGDKKRQSRPSPSAEQEFLHYQWFADYGHAEAARAVAHLLTHGEEQNLISALDYLLQAAEMGDADAMAHVGHAYANGIAVAQNNATARSWFTKAAEKGPCA
jgi:SEL1 protein